MNNIAFVLPSLDRLGGAEIQVIHLANGLLDRGWRVSIVALSGSGGQAARLLVAAGAGFLSLEMRKGFVDPRGWLRFHRWLRRASPDLVHAHLPHAVWIARWSRLFAPVPVLIDSIHTSATGPLGRRIGYRASAWLSDRVCAVSQDAADAYRSARMVSSNQLTVISNGVDVDHWCPDLTDRESVRSELGLTDEFLWFAAGRLDAVKDYPALLHAMSKVPRPFQLVIAGAGPMENELRRLVVELNLEERVRFLGFQSDLRPWMRSADGFVLSSRWEGLPTCLLEAGACGLPAVATAVPGTRQVIIDGKTGFLAAPGSPASLDKAMTYLMQIPHIQRKAMGECARRHVVAQFSMSSVLDRWESLYRELLESHPHPARMRTRTAPHS